MTDETVRETSTGYLSTTLTVSERGEHTLVRRAGADRPARPAPSSAHLDHVARSVGPPSLTSPGWARGDAWHHPVPGPASLALLLSAGMRDEPLLRLCASVGTTLGEVHSRPVQEPLDEPSGLGRLRGWSRTGPRAAGQALDVVAEELGADGLDALLADLDAVTAATPVTTLLGAPGSQSVFPDPRGGPPTVLVTDEIAGGPPAWDLGWFVGELVERSLGTPAGAPALQRAARHLLGAHAATAGSVTAPQDVAVAAAARIVVHVHDYAAYVGWHDSLRERLRAVARLRDDARARPGPGRSPGHGTGHDDGWFVPEPPDAGAAPPTSSAPSATSRTTPSQTPGRDPSRTPRHEHQEST